MGNVVRLPDAPEWASAIDAGMLDALIAKGYLQHHQRHDWCTVEKAICNSGMLLNSGIALSKAFLDKYLELGHEIERARRCLASKEEADRRDYIESFITGYERDRRECPRLIREGLGIKG